MRRLAVVNLTFLILLVVILPTLLRGGDTPPAASATKWEYKTIILNTEGTTSGMDASLNQLGHDGWEVCGSTGAHAICKRPLMH